jgi:hypothetical protein
MKFLSRVGIRIIMVGIALIIAFFGAAIESLKVSGRYTDLYALESETLKNGGHYGGIITWVYGNYAEEGYSADYSDEVVNVYEQYYLTDVYIESEDKWMFVSFSLRDDDMINMANTMSVTDYEEGDPDYIFEMSGICEPLEPELQGYLMEYFEVDAATFAKDFLPYNIRQVDESANGTIIIIGVVVIIVFGIAITVIVKKSKQKKAEMSNDGTVYMDLPPEIAAAVKKSEYQNAASGGFVSAPANAGMDEIGELPDMTNIKQPDNDSFFADLDRKKTKAATPTDPAATTATTAAASAPTPTVAPTPFVSSEMDAITLPDGGEIPPETEPEFTRPASAASGEKAPGVGETRAEDYLNKDFLQI